MRDLSKNILIVLLALVLVLMDSSFFTLFAMNGISIISSFAALIIVALLNSRSNFIIFSLSLILFLTIFSSLSPIFIIFAFFVVPAAVLFLRQNYLPEPSIMFSLVYFVFGFVFLGSFLILYGNNLSVVLARLLLQFVALNSVTGLLFYYLTIRSRNYLQPGKQIRL